MFVYTFYDDFKLLLEDSYSEDAIKMLYDYFQSIEVNQGKEIAIDLELLKAIWFEFSSFDAMVEEFANPSARHDWEIGHLQTDGDFVWTEEEEKRFRAYYLEKLSARYEVYPFGKDHYLLRDEGNQENPELEILGFVGFSAF